MLKKKNGGIHRTITLTEPVQGTQNLVPKKVHIIFVFVSFIEGTPLLRGKGHFFWVLKPRFNLHSEDTLALKKWLTTKIVDKQLSNLHSGDTCLSLEEVPWIEVPL